MQIFLKILEIFDPKMSSYTNKLTDTKIKSFYLDFNL